MSGPVFVDVPCQIDPPAWFSDDTDDQRYALAQCGQCPMRDKCLAYAMDLEGGRAAGTRFGIWGGLTPQDRVNLWRKRIRDRRRVA